MAASNRSGRPTPKTASLSIGEHLAPLAAALPEPPPGRIRSLPEARSALKIPLSAEREVLRAWGPPQDFQLTVYPVSDPNQPQLVAEFAALRVIKRQGSRLVTSGKRTHLRIREKSGALWVVYGSIVVAAHETLAIESLAIGPAFTGQLSNPGDEIAQGVSAQLLRLLSPTRLLSACVEQLQTAGYWLDTAERLGVTPPMSEAQRALLKRIDQARPRRAAVTDDQLVELAKRYIVLCQRGNRRPRAQLAREFGITPEQVRDRIHQARLGGYLTPGKQGRSGAAPGPRLKKLGWSPPQPDPTWM